MPSVFPIAGQVPSRMMLWAKRRDPADGVRFTNVSFTYPDAYEPALSDVTLHLPPGSNLAIVGDNGRVIASDILPMDPLDNVDFIQGDFTDDGVFQQILEKLGERQADLIISDIAPNISGVAAADQAASMYLVELVLDMVRQVLRPGGNFVAKVFQGEGSDEYLKDVRSSFDKVVIRKPEASRPRSREVYLVAKGFKG